MSDSRVPQLKIREEATFYLYPELLGADLHRAGAWMHNAYIYCRMKLKYPEGTTILFKHIETGAMIGRYEGGKVEMV